MKQNRNTLLDLIKKGLNYINPSRNSELFKYFSTSFLWGKSDQASYVNEGFSLNTYVYSIVNRICETASDIPIKLFKIDSSGDKEEITSGEIFDFIHRPNEDMSYKDFTHEALAYKLISGNTIQYRLIPIGFKTPTKRYNLATQYLQVDSKETFKGYQPTLFKYKFGKSEYKYSPEEVVHIKSFNPDKSDKHCLGMSPLQAGARTVEASNQIITADASMIKNRGAMGMISSSREKPLTAEEKKWADEAVKRRVGGADKFGSIGVTSGDFKFIPFNMSPTDLKILESGVMKLRDICSIYGAKSRMFNDPTGASYNNNLQDSKDFYVNAVIPPLEKEIESLNHNYIRLFSERDNVQYIVELDKEAIEALQEDQAKAMIKNRNRSQIIRDILIGIGRDWSEESAMYQLMDALDMSEDEARKLIDKRIENGNDGSED